MQKGIITIIILGKIAILIAGCYSNNRISKPGEIVNLYPIGKEGVWGYSDSNGDLVINYKYRDAKFFSNGLAAVQIDKKYGYINKLGEFEIKPKFDSAYYFGYNKAHVKSKERLYSIKRKGKKQKFMHLPSEVGSCIPPKEISNTEDYFEYKNGSFQLKNKELKRQQRFDPLAKYTIQDFTFDELIPFSSKSIIVKKGDKFGIYIHQNGVGLKELWFDEIRLEHNPLNHGNSTYETSIAEFRMAEYWGLVSDLGHIILEPKYYNIKKEKGIFYLVEYKPQHWGCLTLREKYFKH